MRTESILFLLNILTSFKISNMILKEALESTSTQIPESKSNIQSDMEFPSFRRSREYVLRQTIMGEMCASNYEFEGQIYDECFLAPNKKEYCKTDIGMVRECEPLPPPPTPEPEPEPEPENEISPKLEPKPEPGAVQYTVTGKVCVFPVVYKGKTYDECIEIGGSNKKVCFVDGKWEECRQNNLNRFLTDGRKCVFPFIYNQIEQYDCVKMPDEYEYCKIDGAWQQCEPLIQPTSPDTTTTDYVKTLEILEMNNQESATDMQDSNKKSSSSTAVTVISILMAILVVAVASVAVYVWKIRKNNDNSFNY